MMAKAFKFAQIEHLPMKWRLRIEVGLKPGHSDPEGETTAQLLKELGYKIDSVSVGKAYTAILEASSKKNAQIEAEEMCKRLLANPTKDNYSITIEET
jgi:phosphoribosylformylglycinamidine synthase